MALFWRSDKSEGARDWLPGRPVQLWRQRSPEEQRALYRLACAHEPLDADPATRQLAREGYVEMEGERATVAVPLFAAWIRRTQGRAEPLQTDARFSTP